MVYFRYVVVNIVHKVDNKDNNNMGNWNHLKIICKGTEQDTFKAHKKYSKQPGTADIVKP